MERSGVTASSSVTLEAQLQCLLHSTPFLSPFTKFPDPTPRTLQALTPALSDTVFPEVGSYLFVSTFPTRVYLSLPRVGRGERGRGLSWIASVLWH